MLGQVAGFDNDGSHDVKKVFQRIEVWVLLVLALGATAFVFLTSRQAEERPPVVSNAEPARPEAKLTVRSCTLKRDFGNARLDLQVHLTNRRASKLLLVNPAVRLLNAKNAEVPAFILPVEPPPELPPQTTADVLLRFWLEQEDLQGALTLEVDGERVAVKGGNPFKLDQLKNAEPRSFAPGDEWR
jgi:hypothetical protein